MATFRILIVDDEPKLSRILTDALAADGREIRAAGSAAEAWRLFEEQRADLVITDLRMESEEAGLELLARIHASSPATPSILITAFATIAAGMKALKLGAVEYMVKPVRVRALRETVAGLERRLVGGSPVQVAVDDEVPHSFDGILVGTHPGMRRIYELLPRVIASDSNVLIIGESGTGKEVFAHAIHEHGPRARKPFVRVNCAALVDTLLESELFGIEAGVATDVKERAGKFEQADGGTILLDEIGDMAPATQAKVLRVIQEREFERVGGRRSIKVDVRLIAATHRDLEEMVDAGSFRQDLFYRINVIRLDLPPLRERLGDISLYARFFLAKLGERMGRPVPTVSAEALAKLACHSWPGNVRELENVLERALALSMGGSLEPADLPPLERRGEAGAAGESLFRLPEEGLSLEALERDLIAQALARSGGNKSAASRLLGLTRRTLGYRLEKHGLGAGEGEDGRS